MNKNTHFIDVVIYAFIALSTALFVIGLDYKNAKISVVISFLIIGIFAFACIVKKGVDVNIYNIMHIFVYVFFFMAPLQQYTSRVVLWRGNGLNIRYSDADYFKANCIILIFLFLFNVAYYFSKTNQDNKKEIFIVKTFPVDKKVIFTLVSTVAFLIIVATGNLQDHGMAFSSDNNVSIQITNILRYIPVCAFIIYGVCYKSFRQMIRQKSFWIIFIQIALIFFPFWGHIARYFLFGTYVLILSVILADKNKNHSWVFLVFYIGFCIFFSSLRYATEINVERENVVNFLHADFDAYQMLMAIIRYTDEYGVVYGKNIFSALMFLVPRSVWSGKMINTGSIVVSHYGSWFENVSSPLVAELYFAFGWVGVIIGAVALGKLVRKTDSFQDSESLWKRGLFCIFTGMTIYIMRGSLLATMAFSLGLLLSLFTMCIISVVRIKGK